VDIAALAAVVITQIVGLVKYFRQLDSVNGVLEKADQGRLSYAPMGWLIASAVMVLVGGTWKVLASRAKSRSASEAESPGDILGCCYVLRALVMGPETNGCSKSIRVSIYKVHRDRSGQVADLEQLIPYVNAGGHNSGSPGRRLTAKTGIVGRVARGGNPLAVSCEAKSVEEFEAAMVREWGFTPEEAKDLKRKCRSWMGVPVTDKQDRVAGVIYLDSEDKDSFTPEIQERVFSGCGAMTAFLRERYK